MSDLQSVLSNLKAAKIIQPSTEYSKYVAIDLSKSSLLLNDVTLESANDLEDIIHKFMTDNEAKIAFGGYLEERNLYKRSELFAAENHEDRNIHLGLDLWTNAGTSIHAALNAKVHSFKNNEGLGNYGPTIILEHLEEEITFYTLYGHLSTDSLTNIREGDSIAAGDKIGYLGSAEVNGDYAPHLHFQIIEDIDDYVGDYPGVCSKTNADFYRNNCPNPELLLKISKE